MKLLGVLIDSDLNFSKHIAQVCRKASQQIGIVSRLKKFSTSSSKTHTIQIGHPSTPHLLSKSLALCQGSRYIH